MENRNEGNRKEILKFNNRLGIQEEQIVMATKEHTFQFQLVSYLRLRNFIVVDCDIMDGLKYAKTQYRYPFIVHHKKMGYVKGQPDLIVMKNGKVYCLELKSEKGKQSKEQKQYQQLCKDNNIEYLVVRNFDDLKQLY